MLISLHKKLIELAVTSCGWYGWSTNGFQSVVAAVNATANIRKLKALPYALNHNSPCIETIFAFTTNGKKRRKNCWFCYCNGISHGYCQPHSCCQNCHCRRSCCHCLIKRNVLRLPLPLPQHAIPMEVQGTKPDCFATAMVSSTLPWKMNGSWLKWERCSNPGHCIELQLPHLSCQYIAIAQHDHNSDVSWKNQWKCFWNWHSNITSPWLPPANANIIANPK